MPIGFFAQFIDVVEKNISARDRAAAAAAAKLPSPAEFAGLFTRR
ncbi:MULTISPECIES: hypothetical protein [Rhodopseudomonas]|nr:MULTISPECIES: hypothetical protein [Rhodopseudomonas]MDF3811802.1 hypothetical protein [Rhodopseudomonas sp. BAL398]WOK20271.1 hypothetical protein RBJ75_12440 [Rhodopseudomonas sp. BAL398]